MSLSASLRLALALGTLLPVARAAAVCNVPNACNFAHLTSCCSGNTCTIDGVVTVVPPVPGMPCSFDFQTRTVLVRSGGRFDVGSNTAAIAAGSFRIQSPGELRARGSAGTPGGNVTILINTAMSGAPIAFGLEGASGAKIDLSGGAGHAGTLSIFADGPVSFTPAGDGVRADAMAPGTAGGSIHVDSTKGPITIGTNFFLQSQDAAGNAAGGGMLRIRCNGPSCDVNVSKTVGLDGTANGGGTLDIDVSGKVSFTEGSVVHSDGFNGKSGSGGFIDVAGSAIDALGEVRAKGGGPATTGGLGGNGGAVNLEARTGRLFIKRSTVGIALDGATLGAGGELTLTARGTATQPNPMNGLIDIQAPLSLQGDGGGGFLDAAANGGIKVAAAINANGNLGGFADLTLDAVRDVDVQAQISSIDAEGGGTFTILSGRDTILNANITMRALLSADADGGEIDIAAGRDVILQASRVLDVNGSISGFGGTVAIEGRRNVRIESGAAVIADGGGGGQDLGAGGGGDITLIAGSGDHTGDVTVNGTVRAFGPQAPAGGLGGGTIEIDGCTVTVAGQLDTRGPGSGTNDITARNRLTGNGPILAAISNLLTLRTGAPAPGGAPTPAYMLTSRPSCTAVGTPPNCLTPCPTCGDGNEQFPEECDDGNTIHCDTCTELCRDSCVDDRACNGTETCVFDVCVPGTTVQCVPGTFCIEPGGTCGCLSDAGCQDGNVCNGAEDCAGGSCQPGTPLNCADTDPCTIDDCNPVAGCTHTPEIGCQRCSNPGQCVDDNPCTTDACTGGRCVFDKIDGCCVTAIDCDDTEACTIDTCVGGPPTGDCNHAPNDGAACGNVCQPGVCEGTTCNLGDPLVCTEDTDPCTIDFCDSERGCVHDPVDLCCTMAEDPRCNDGDACTLDTCDTGLLRCSNTPISPCQGCTTDTECDPLGRCGQSVCGPAGACVPSTPPNCDDGNPRTQDSCVLDAGGAPVCRSQCVTQEACDDGDLCTVDSCDPTQGCVNAPVTDFDTVGCRIATIQALLDGAAPEDLQSKLGTTLRKLLGKARTKLEQARSRGLTKRAKKPLNAVNKKLKKIKKATDNGFRKSKVSEALAIGIGDATQRGIDAVGTLRQQLTT